LLGYQMQPVPLLKLERPNNSLSGLFPRINAYRRQNFLLNLSTRGL
jgi:hypothetical protein